MKKIITSAAVAAALTTGAFAATALTYSDAPTTGFTYNEKLIAVVAYDANLTNATDLDADTDKDTGIVYTPSVKLAQSNFLTVKLTGGAKFLGSAVDWKLTDINNSVYATTINASETMTELEFQVAKDVPASGALYLTTGVADANKSAIQLPKGTTGDIKLEFSARSDGGSVIGLAAVSTVIFDGVSDKAPTATLDCNEAQIDSTTLSKFVANESDTPKTTTSAVSCGFTLATYTPNNIDFNLTDTNLTVVTTGGAFVDGNVTNFGGLLGVPTSNGTTGMTFANINSPLAPIASSELRFTLTNTTKKIDTNQIDAKVTCAFNKAVLAPSTASKVINHKTTLIDTSKAMSYLLSTYKANILNLRYNSANVTNTYINIYNNSAADTVAKATITNPDATTVEIASLATVPKNGMTTVNFGTLMTSNPSVKVGAQIDISMPIDAKLGDVVVFQNQPTGRSALRVVDNNGKSKGM